MEKEIIITENTMEGLEYIEKDLFKKLIKTYEKFKLYYVYKYKNGKMIFLYRECENNGSTLRNWRYTTMC